MADHLAGAEHIVVHLSNVRREPESTQLTLSLFPRELNERRNLDLSLSFAHGDQDGGTKRHDGTSGRILLEHPSFTYVIVWFEFDLGDKALILDEIDRLVAFEVREVWKGDRFDVFEVLAVRWRIVAAEHVDECSCEEAQQKKQHAQCDEEKHIAFPGVICANHDRAALDGNRVGARCDHCRCCGSRCSWCSSQRRCGYRRGNDRGGIARLWRS